MKKLFLTGLIAALAFSQVAKAELEISGNVTTLGAYQHDDSDAGNTTGAGGLTQGELRWNPTANADHFGFLVDQAEVDLENEFGEYIMARMDLDFIDLGTPSASAFFLEQAYVTANVAVGNGMEFLVGKFNAPVSLESVDRYENVFSTYTPGWVFLAPKQVLGAKMFYAFNDNWNMDLAVVNSLNNTNSLNSALPSGILRVGANWGDEGHESNFNVAFGFGPEYSGAVGAAAGGTATSQNKHFDWYGSIWGNWALGESFDLGWEGTGRRSGSDTGPTNQLAFHGQLYGLYQASDVWTVQLRGSYFHEVSAGGNGTGASTTGTTWGGHHGQTYSGTLGATYQITEDAEMTLEYRFDYAAVKNLADAQFHTGVMQFAYSF